MIREVRTTAFWQAVCCLAGSCSKTFWSWSLRIKESEKNDWVARAGQGNIDSSRQNGIILMIGGKKLYVCYATSIIWVTLLLPLSKVSFFVKAFLVFGHPYPTMALSAADLQVPV